MVWVLLGFRVQGFTGLCGFFITALKALIHYWSEFPLFGLDFVGAPCQ